MNRREAVIGCVVSLLALVQLLCLHLLIENKSGSRTATTAFSSYLFPTGTLVIMLACGLKLSLQAFLAVHDGAVAGPIWSWPVMAALLVSVAYALLMPVLGFLSTTIPAMAIIFRVFGLDGRVKTLFFSVAAAVFIYMVFAVFLRVPVPVGVLI